MDISNRALGLLLIAAIVVSIGGTFISLDRLDAVSTTGFATNNVSGTVNISINSSLSITMSDASIDFGDCALVPGEVLIINSEATGANQSYCSLATEDHLSIENDGNVNANVVLRSDVTGPTLFSDPSSTLKYKSTAAATNNGCQSGLVGTYQSVAAADTDYAVCTNLTYGTNRFFDTQFEIGLASTSQTGTATITFEASLA